MTVRTQRLLSRGELPIAAPLKSDGVGGLPKNERGDGKLRLHPPGSRDSNKQR